MSGSIPDPEYSADSLSQFEADLRGLTPALGEFHRDAVLFHSGEQAALRKHRRAVRRWQAACGLLAAVTLGQSVWVASVPATPTQPQIAAPTAPSPADLPVAPPSLVNAAAGSAPSSDVEVDRPTVVAWIAPIWAPGRLAAGEGLRSGSSLAELDPAPQFIPRTATRRDSDRALPFPYSASRELP